MRRSLHSLSNAKVPHGYIQGATIATIVLYFLVITSTGCGLFKQKVPVHPGAVSNLDSYAYDILLVEQSTLNSAVASFKAGTLPPNAKDPLNGAIQQYNTAQGAWQAYHAGGGNGTVLQQALDALIGAVGQLQKSLGASPSQITTRN